MPLQKKTESIHSLDMRVILHCSQCEAIRWELFTKTPSGFKLMEGFLTQTGEFCVFSDRFHLKSWGESVMFRRELTGRWSREMVHSCCCKPKRFGHFMCMTQHEI